MTDEGDSCRSLQLAGAGFARSEKRGHSTFPILARAFLGLRLVAKPIPPLHGIPTQLNVGLCRSSLVQLQRMAD